MFFKTFCKPETDKHFVNFVMLNKLSEKKKKCWYIKDVWVLSLSFIKKRTPFFSNKSTTLQENGKKRTSLNYETEEHPIWMKRGGRKSYQTWGSIKSLVHSGVNGQKSQFFRALCKKLDNVKEKVGVEKTRQGYENEKKKRTREKLFFCYKLLTDPCFVLMKRNWDQFL